MCGGQLIRMCTSAAPASRSIFTIADRVAMLYKGKVKAVGTPDELRANQDPIIQQFINGLPEGPLETT